MSFINSTFISLIILVFIGVSNAKAEQSLSPEEVKKLALEAILENPEIITQAISRLEELEAERRRVLISQCIPSSPNGPIGLIA